MNKKILFPLIQSRSAAMQQCMRTVDMVALTDVAVLILGETGAGKAQIASAIHQKSSRGKKPFIRLNCATLTTEQAESFIFGTYQKNHQGNVYKGLLAEASQGTLYLENIDSLASDAQNRLLDFLKQGECRAVGQIASCHYNVRVMASSSRDLEQQVKQQAFNRELFYYLNIVPVQVPALRERKEDLFELIQAMFVALVREYRLPAPLFSEQARKALSRYDWQGNLLELHHFCERMLILFAGKTIELTNLPGEIQQHFVHNRQLSALFTLPDQGIKLEEMEKTLLQQAILKSNGNKSRAARLLGLSRDTFLYRLKKYGIAWG